MQRVGEALARVDAAAGQQPVLAAPGLLVPAEQDAVLPAQHGGHADTRLDSRHHTADEPKPRTPRSLVGQLVDLDGVELGDLQDDELRDAHARLDDERLTRIGVEKDHLQLAAVTRVDEAGRVHDRDPVLAPRARSAAGRSRRSRRGSPTASPVHTVARSPGPSSTRSHAARSRPASPAYARVGTTASSRKRWMGSSITRR